MPIIASSKDLVLVVLAVCIFWLTFFLCWLMYSFIVIIRDAESLVRMVKNAVERVDKLAGVVRDKFEHSAASLTVVAQAVKELVMWAMEERSRKRTSGRKKKSEGE